MNLTKTKSSEIATAVRASALTALLLLTLGYAAPDARATVAPGPYNGPAATVGTEFWFAFGDNLIEETNYVNISGTTATTATVAVPALGFSVDVSVTPGQTTSVAVPTGTDLRAPDGVESLGVHVTSAAAAPPTPPTATTLRAAGRARNSSSPESRCGAERGFDPVAAATSVMSGIGPRAPISWPKAPGIRRKPTTTRTQQYPDLRCK